MDTFLHKHAANVMGVLNGFDRLVFRGALRRLVFLEGMKSYLWAANVLLKDFGKHVLAVTSLLKKASSEIAQHASRPMKYLPSSGTDKDKVARRIAQEHGVKEGLICVLTCVEPCVSFDIHRNRETKRLELVTRYRKCLHVYHYSIHPLLGFMNARIQTWFPFNVRLLLGRWKHISPKDNAILGLAFWPAREGSRDVVKIDTREGDDVNEKVCIAVPAAIHRHPVRSVRLARDERIRCRILRRLRIRR